MRATLWPEDGHRFYPFGNKGGRSALGLAFLSVAGLGDGDVEKERDLKVKADAALQTPAAGTAAQRRKTLGERRPGAAAAEGAVLGGVAGVGAEGRGVATGARRPRARVGRRARG